MTMARPLTMTWCVQGTFEVRALQPVNYVIEEMDGLLNPANKVGIHFLPARCAPCRLTAILANRKGASSCQLDCYI